MKELRNVLNVLIDNTTSDKSIIQKILNEKALFPFTTENRLLSYFLSTGEITYGKYLQIYGEYRQRNRYLDLYEMAPRTYGQTWGEEHIRSLFPEFIKATKENLTTVYPNFDGEFDLWLDGIRIEVKACRANFEKGTGSLTSRAYLHSEARDANFKYHYQQLKPSCCDIFIWIGTCRDELLYWILTSDELNCTGKLGPQHRNENTGLNTMQIFEGQVFMTEEELEPYRVHETEILNTIIKKCRG